MPKSDDSPTGTMSIPKTAAGLRGWIKGAVFVMTFLGLGGYGVSKLVPAAASAALESKVSVVESKIQTIETNQRAISSAIHDQEKTHGSDVGAMMSTYAALKQQVNSEAERSEEFRTEVRDQLKELHRMVRWMYNNRKRNDDDTDR